MGFLNGLNVLGTNMAAFAGTAGLEQQKSDLAKQSMVLADQLATTRESAGRQEAGAIAATAAEKQQAFAASESGLQRGSSMDIAKLSSDTSIKTAGISAGAAVQSAGIQAAASKYSADLQSKGLYAQLDAMAPERAQQVLASQQDTALKHIQETNASQLQDANNTLASEQAKPQPDPDKVAAAKAQILALGYSSTAEQARAQAAAAIYRTDMDSVQHFNQQLVAATAELNKPGMEDTDRAAQKGVVANLQSQLNGAQKALQYSADLAHPPTTPAPPLPVGVPPGAHYSPSLRIWQDTTGKYYDVNGNPTQAPGTNPPGAMGLLNGTQAGGPR